MFAGIGIIGALASILASLLVSPATPEPAPDAEPTTPVAPEADGRSIVATAELDAIRAELAALRASLDRGGEPGRT